MTTTLRRTQLASALAAAMLVLRSASAMAAPPAPAPAGTQAAPRAGAPGTATAAPATAASEKAGEEASNHFKRGLQLFDDGEYTLALVEFERAYQLAPNYRALYNIALVDMQLGRYADAARTLEQYLHDGGDGIAPARRVEVTKTLSQLKLRTATIDITLNVPGAEVTLDGKPIDPARLRGPMVIDAGEHTLRASATGYLASDRTVTLAGGDRASVKLDLRPFNQPHGPTEPTKTHVVFWPGFVVTGVLAAGSIVSGVIMLDNRSRLNQLQNTASTSDNAAADAAARTSAANTVNTTAAASDIMAGLAVVAGAISLYLSLGPEHPTRAPSVAVSPQRVVLSMPF